MSGRVLSSEQRRAYQANIARFFAFSFLHNFQLWIPIWIIYLQQQRGLSLTEITFLDAPFFLTQVLAEVPTGALADRYGRKPSLILGGATISIAVFVFGIADNFPLILTSYVFWGIGMGLQSGADQAFLYDSLKQLGREAEYSSVYGRVNATTLVASVAAGLLGAPLAAETSLATPVLASAAMSAASMLVAFTFKEPPMVEGRLPYLQTIAAGVSQVRGNQVLRLVMLFGVVSTMTFWVTQYFMQPFLIGHGASVASLGLLLMPVRLVSAAASFVAYRIERSLGSWRSIAITAAVSIAACAGLALWDSGYAFCFVPVAAAASTTRMLLVSHYINARISSDQRATIVSMYALAGALASSVSAPVYGFIADEVSLRAVFATVAVVAAAILPLILLLWRRAESSGGQASSISTEAVQSAAD